MRGSRLILSATLATLLALLAWLSVGYLALMVRDEATAYQGTLSGIARDALLRDEALKLRALAASTAQRRERLAAAIPADPVSIAQAIDATGKAARVSVRIGAAMPVQLSASAPKSLRAVEFLVRADGTFAQVMRATELFEHLPMPSTVTAIDLERVPGTPGKSAPWRLTLRLRVLTTAAVSS